jgi:hypothetical protein
MDFREQIIEYRKSAPSVSSLSIDTDLYFLEKYGTDGKGAKYKFDGTLIPGNIYFFSYDTNTELSDKVPFINRNPLILYLSSEKIGEDIVVKSIDLTVTPPEQRLEIVQNFWNQFKSSIEEGIKKTEEGNAPNSVRVDSKSIPRLFEGTGYSSSFVGFKYKFMRNVKWVDYSDWAKLPFLKYSSVQGLSINEIYTNYRSKLIK